MYAKYIVTIEKFAEKYYLKNFRKRYKISFDIPWRAFLFMLQRFDLMLEKGRTNKISNSQEKIVICKTDFKIRANESAKSSGNRCVIAQDKERLEVKILLVYCKNDIQGTNETLWWKNKIKENYPKYRDLL